MTADVSPQKVGVFDHCGKKEEKRFLKIYILTLISDLGTVPVEKELVYLV